MGHETQVILIIDIDKDVKKCFSIIRYRKKHLRSNAKVLKINRRWAVTFTISTFIDEINDMFSELKNYLEGEAQILIMNEHDTLYRSYEIDKFIYEDHVL